MGELPPERVQPAFPFVHTGVDYCGPFSCRPTRRATAVKCYVSVFVCLVTKAVHLECVADLTTNSFLAALRRFVARRGKPELIECDNALNFQGAKRELEELARLFRSQQHQDQITRSCAEDGITFKFIPPRSPNFGGLWEAAVKSMKNHLRRTMGNVILYQDEFWTLLVQIESCLNSRPLTQLTSDPNDLEVLTPGHFFGPSLAYRHPRAQSSRHPVQPIRPLSANPGVRSKDLESVAVGILVWTAATDTLDAAA